MDQEQDQADLAFVLVFVLKPKVVHHGTPCTRMCLAGKRDIDAATHRQNEFSRKSLVHQVSVGMHGSAENPKGTLLYVEPGWTKCFGTVAEPIHPWRLNKGDGCQMAVV